MYVLQIPFVGGIVKSLFLVQPEKRYLLNKFSIAGFCFHEGEENLHKMNVGDSLSMKLEKDNAYDKYAIELYWKGKKVGYVPRSDNRHLYRLMKQGKSLVCTIREINPNGVTWQMCKVKVEMIG